MTSRVGSWTRSHRKTRLNQTVLLSRVFWCDHGYDPTHLNKTVSLSRVFRCDHFYDATQQNSLVELSRVFRWDRVCDAGIKLGLVVQLSRTLTCENTSTIDGIAIVSPDIFGTLQRPEILSRCHSIRNADNKDANFIGCPAISGEGQLRYSIDGFGRVNVFWDGARTRPLKPPQADSGYKNYIFYATRARGDNSSLERCQRCKKPSKRTAWYQVSSVERPRNRECIRSRWNRGTQSSV